MLSQQCRSIAETLTASRRLCGWLCPLLQRRRWRPLAAAGRRSGAFLCGAPCNMEDFVRDRPPFQLIYTGTSEIFQATPAVRVMGRQRPTSAEQQVYQNKY